MPIDLSNLAEGAVHERFNQEFQKVIENLADPNTNPAKARKVTMIVTIKGDENRDVASWTFRPSQH